MSIRQSLLYLVVSCWSLAALALDDIYVYPNQGQGAEQQSQDRYQCHSWAVGQSGFDPSTYATAGGPVYVASAAGAHYPPHGDINPISGAAGGAALGALGGAIAGDAGKGAAIGAGVGALAGIFNAAGNQQRSRSYRAQQQAQVAAALEQDQANYRRAISACLEAHNYTVR